MPTIKIFLVKAMFLRNVLDGLGNMCPQPSG